METTQNEEELFLDKIINKLWKGYDHSERWSAKLTSAEVQFLIRGALEVVKDQPVFLRLRSPITLVGDLHGQFDDLLYYFKYCGLPPKTNYLFLGDYVDRKARGLEIMCLLMAYKIKYRSHIFFLRGNHEAGEVNEIHGFKDECLRRCNLATYNMFQELFSYLPIAALVGDRIFCVHGGLSPYLSSLRQINEIQRPYKVPPFGLITDLLWSDPNENVRTYAAGKRMISYQYGQLAIEEFMRRFNIDLIVRAHETVDGYQFMFNRRLVTLFSAPEYAPGLKNSGAAMVVSKNLEINFVVLRPKCRQEEDLKLALNKMVILKSKEVDSSSISSSSSDSSDDDHEVPPQHVGFKTDSHSTSVQLSPYDNTPLDSDSDTIQVERDDSSSTISSEDMDN